MKIDPEEYRTLKRNVAELMNEYYAKMAQGPILLRSQYICGHRGRHVLRVAKIVGDSEGMGHVLLAPWIQFQCSACGLIYNVVCDRGDELLGDERAALAPRELLSLTEKVDMWREKIA